jgi:xylan 1,4-beta-xylosidase
MRLPLTFAATLLLCLTLARGQSSSRTISSDFNAITGTKSTVYRQCVGAGRVDDALRADWQQQLRTCKQEIGFEYLRCLGVLQDELAVYSEDAAGHPIYNWQYIDIAYDFLHSIGVRPFVEIGFMPQALASIKTDPSALPPDKRQNAKLAPAAFWWHADMSAPKSWRRWDDLITALVRHWTDRYGAAEVRQWYFEVWNEADYPPFFTPVNEDTRYEEYFALYDHTARAIKSVDPAYCVGGPAAAGPYLAPEFVAYCAEHHTPVDFLSYHGYGIGKGPAATDPDGKPGVYLNPNLDAVADQLVGERTGIRQAGSLDLPVYVTAWNSSYVNYDHIHDSYFQAPYILEQLKRTESFASMVYWTFTDIFEAIGPPTTPFEGGFGLINLQGIKKPAYFAYQFLNQLGDQQLKDSDDRSWVCRDKAGGIQVLAYDLTDPRGSNPAISDGNLFGKPIVPGEKPPLDVRISSVPPGRYHLAVRRIGYKENDAFTAYMEMGSPSQLTLAQVQRLQDLAAGKPVEEDETVIDQSGLWDTQVSMRDNEVVLLTLTPE